MTPQQILELPMPDNDAKAATIRDYFVSVAAKVWKDGEAFSGKRPFGNSDWQADVYTALISEGVIEGDEDGYPLDEREADRIILEAIRAI